MKIKQTYNDLFRLALYQILLLNKHAWNIFTQIYLFSKQLKQH